MKMKQDLVKVGLELPDDTSALEVRTADGVIWKLAILSYKFFGEKRYMYEYVSSDKTMYDTSLYSGGITGGGVKKHSLNESQYEFVTFYEDLE